MSEPSTPSFQGMCHFIGQLSKASKAGMRAALAGVLKRFEPEALEQRVAARSLLDNLLPGSRKARLWDLFEQMYGEISQEAEDDFHALFGREFLRAYEEQVERLQAEREPDR